MEHRRTPDDRGASAVEYGLLVAGIATLIVLAVYAFGGMAKNVAGHNCTHITGSTGSTIQTDCD